MIQLLTQWLANLFGVTQLEEFRTVATNILEKHHQELSEAKARIEVTYRTVASDFLQFSDELNGIRLELQRLRSEVYFNKTDEDRLDALQKQCAVLEARLEVRAQEQAAK